MKHVASALTVVAVAAVVGVQAEDAVDWGIYQAGDVRSGYTYASAETRAIQDDEFENPGILWVEKGEELWETADGKSGKSCAGCHGDAAEAMDGVATYYPVYSAETNRMMNIENRINQCRVKQMDAAAWKYESEPLLSMTAFVKYQSKDQPVSPIIDGPAAPFFEKGKAFYHERRGQLDLACIHCHEMNHGRMLRAQRLSMGMSNGFPTYRLKWQSLGSLHRRIRGCNRNVRSTPYPAGSPEYVNLELYLAWRARGLPVETPSVRN